MKPGVKNMAKKTAKSGAKKSASAKKTAKKAGGKKPAAKSASKGGGGAKVKSPYPVTTGKGPSAAEVGNSLVQMFNSGKVKEVEDKWWAPSIVSVEGFGMAWAGRKAVDEKNKKWDEENEVVGAAAEGPYVGASGFGVKFKVEVVERATGKRMKMEEIGVYQVQDGKIVREEFMYGAMA